MSDPEYVDLVVRVPTEVVRKWKEYAGSTAAEYQDWATKDGASPVATNIRSFGYAARAAALEFDLPPERVPVTPETPWGTKVVSPYGTRYLFMGTDPWDELTDDGRPRRFWVREQGMNPMDFNLGTDGWFEVERP
jgi:hypothetical protein